MSGYFKNGPREEPTEKVKNQYNSYAKEEELEQYLADLEMAKKGIRPRRSPRRLDYGRGPRY
jgi:hypothetical protein